MTTVVGYVRMLVHHPEVLSTHPLENNHYYIGFYAYLSVVLLDRFDILGDIGIGSKLKLLKSFVLTHCAQNGKRGVEQYIHLRNIAGIFASTNTTTAVIK